MAVETKRQGDVLKNQNEACKNTNNLFEMSVGVVHDGEVLLVDVILLQREGNIGEPEPELVVDRNLQSSLN